MHFDAYNRIERYLLKGRRLNSIDVLRDLVRLVLKSLKADTQVQQAEQMECWTLCTGLLIIRLRISLK